MKSGAGEGNRTLVFSLEGCCSTIELHPQAPEYTGGLHNFVQPGNGAPGLAPRGATVSTREMVGEVGLEPTKA